MKDKEINKLFEKIKPDRDKKDEIYNKIIKVNKNKQYTSKSFKNDKSNLNRLRPALILSLILMFSITVFAVSNIEPSFSDKIKNFTLTEDAQDINISDTDKGYTITAESIF